MGVGSAMAGGCNVGGFYVATSALSFAGPAMMVGLIAGAYLGLRYLYWEMMHLSSSPPKGGGTKKNQSAVSGTLRRRHCFSGGACGGLVLRQRSLYAGRRPAAMRHRLRHHHSKDPVLFCQVFQGSLHDRGRGHGSRPSASASSSVS